MWRVLFPKKSFHKRGGGQIKSRDYFLHCLAHPALDPFISFTDADRFPQHDALWKQVPHDRVLSEADVNEFDLFFISGRNWKYVPKDLSGKPVINLLQSISECAPGTPEHRYLRRAALRICVSDGVERASAPYRNGDAVVIEPGIPLDLFRPDEKRVAGAVLIWGRKDAPFATCLHEELRRRGIDADVLVDYLPRDQWARKLATLDVFVGLPHAEEGFYLPALEAMACGAAVVCADASGNRSFCLPGETCLSPPSRDLVAHVSAVQRLLGERDLADGIRAAGLSIAQRYSIDRERDAFHRLLEERVLPRLR
jgi:hypothetical protein